jgi:hypothetical protein
VKRLLKRTDIRNPDPAPKRYTSLAWAAALGHEETFEYLLIEGHDDVELSKVRCVRLPTSLIPNAVLFNRTLKTTPFS